MVTVIKSYNGSSEQRQLTIQQGDTVTVVKVLDSGWTLATDANGVTGYIPTNYIELEKDVANTDESTEKLATAIYNFKGENDTQISFKAGDSVVIQKVRKDGWSIGHQVDSTHVGYFPSNYVKVATIVTQYKQCDYRFCSRMVLSTTQYCPQCSNYKSFKQILRAYPKDKALKPYKIKKDKHRASVEKNQIMYLMLARLANMKHCAYEGCDKATSGHSELQFCTDHMKEYYHYNQYEYELRQKEKFEMLREDN